MPDINKLLRASPVSSRYGAPMGRVDQVGPMTGLYCQRIRFQDGDYSSDGTYWGSGGGPLYAAFSHDLETLCFARASCRSSALKVFAIQGLSFKRGYNP